MNRNSKMSNSHKMTLLILALIVSIGMVVVLLFNDIMVAKQNHHNIIDSKNRAKWDYVTLIIHQEYEAASKETIVVKEKIISDIEREYGKDTDKLEHDLKAVYADLNGGDGLLDIINNSISGRYFKGIKNDNNDQFVLTKNKIVSDNSLNCAATDRVRTFDLESKGQFAPALAREAFDGIVLQKGNLVFWHYLPVSKDLPWSEEIANMQRMDLNEIKKLFIKYNGDMRILEGFEFISSSYIDERADLLGNTLVDKRGNVQENYQLIVNQGFNVIDLIENNPKYKVSIQTFELDIMWMQNTFVNELYLRAVTLLSLVLLFIVVFLIASYIRNKMK